MSETLEIFGREYTGVTGIKAKDNNGNLVTFIKPEGTLNVSQNGTVDVSQYASANVSVSGGGDTPPAIPALPSEYQEVEYIQFNGAQYLSITANYYIGKIMVDAAADDITVYQCVCGYRTSTNFQADWNLGWQNSSPRWYLRAGYNYMSSKIETTQSRIKAEAIVPWISSLTNTTNPQPRSNYYIGNYYIASGSGANVPFTGKLYSFAILKPIENEWASYMKPCYRKSDNVIGMYDVIGEAFYTNAGSGSFGKGPDVT